MLAKTDCSLPTPKLSAILDKYKKSPGSLLEILREAQAINGYLSREILQLIAEEVGVPESKVYGVATFYSLFKTAPTGRYIIRICESAPCHIRGAQDVLAAIEKTLAIKPGETTPDGKFTLEFTSCLGLCGVAPAMMINDQVFGNLTGDRVREIINSF
ncbi:MAG: NADH-quinone oxidoreductase subunit NuoE [Firmicutes bacterium]|nr:NADH-quinone oxidoreductase subunit NuoE [Bacillota bacterium]